MVRQHHRLNGHESKQILGDGEGQGSLALCTPWGNKESDRTLTVQQQQASFKVKNQTKHKTWKLIEYVR